MTSDSWRLCNVRDLLMHYNVPMDYITLAVFVWNFGTVAMLCIFWKGPMKLQQAFLITSSAVLAITLIKYMPGWTVWFLLGVICLWGNFALCLFTSTQCITAVTHNGN